MTAFSIGTLTGDHVLVTVKGYERAFSGEYYDDNWVAAEVSISMGAFSGRFNAALITHDFVQFRNSAQALHETLRGVAVFSTLEEQLYIKISVDGIGHIKVEGAGVDQPGMGNELKFIFDLDQTYLPELIAGLNEIVTEYPIRD